MDQRQDIGSENQDAGSAEAATKAIVTEIVNHQVKASHADTRLKQMYGAAKAGNESAQDIVEEMDTLRAHHKREAFLLRKAHPEVTDAMLTAESMRQALESYNPNAPWPWWVPAGERDD